MLFAERSYYPRDLYELAAKIGQPDLPRLARTFLQDQLNPGSSSDTDSSDNEDDLLPTIASDISVYHSAVAMFYAPSDPSGIRGMRHERIRSTRSWYGEERRDVALVVENDARPGFRAMSAVRVLLFFSFNHDGVVYPCALVHWYKVYGRNPDPKTGMWIVRPDTRGVGKHPYITVVHLDTLVRNVHLLPVFGRRPVPDHWNHVYTLDCFEAFYVNKYADYHANEILF